MSEYATTTHRTTSFTSSLVQEKKAARRKVLDEIEAKRKRAYARFVSKKRQLQQNSDLI